MMNREQAIAYGKHIGVRWHIFNSNGCLVGGTDPRAGTGHEAPLRNRGAQQPLHGAGRPRFEIREAK